MHPNFTRKSFFPTFFLFCIISISHINAQVTTQNQILQSEIPPTQNSTKAISLEKLEFIGDIRLRLEYDWHSQKTDGSFRDNRWRYRYRLRFGFNYQWNESITMGARMRNGNPFDQQGPHTTFGSGTGEFRLWDLNIEKVFIKGKHGEFWWWAGKNSYPFFKQHELFWNDNVMPEGVSLGHTLHIGKNYYLQGIAAHYIINHSGKSFADDAYLSALQINILNKQKKMPYTLSAGIFNFNDAANLPDGYATYVQDYRIAILGGELKLNADLNFRIGGTYYHNMIDYQDHSILKDSPFKDDKTGWVANAKIGNLKKKGDIFIGYYYAHMGKYSAVDYYAQNDWARWDYSGMGASGSRLTNFQGHELRIGYAFGPKFDLIARGYSVKTLHSADNQVKETGNRFRVDINLKI